MLALMVIEAAAMSTLNQGWDRIEFPPMLQKAVPARLLHPLHKPSDDPDGAEDTAYFSFPVCSIRIMRTSSNIPLSRP
jgi:hypothetical protein